MSQRVIAASGWLIALVLVVVAVPLGWAQPTPADGAFIRSADGTVYAVSRGARVRIAPAPDSSLLSGLREGPAVATVDELNAALAALVPPPVISNPVETLLGQSARVCAGDRAFQAEVTGAEWVKVAGNRSASGSAMWAIVYLEMTNLSATEGAPYQGGTAALQLMDERGRNFSGDIGFALFDFQRGLAASGGRLPFTDPLRPGIQDSRVIGFEVAPDVRSLTLATQFPC